MVSARKSILSAVPSQAVVHPTSNPTASSLRPFERYLISRRLLSAYAPRLSPCFLSGRGRGRPNHDRCASDDRPRPTSDD